MNESNKLEFSSKEEEKAYKKEHSLSLGKNIIWQTRLISSGIIVMVLGFVSIFATDTLGLAPGVVGTILMVSKIFDGITDLIFGYVIDNTNSRFGRGRPYDLCIIGIWLSTILLFFCPPEASEFAKIIWLFVCYVFINSVWMTLLTTANNVYMFRAFKYEEQYVAITTYGSIFTMLGVAAFNILFPIAMGTLATSAQGWRSLILIFALPLMILGLIRFFIIKEVSDVDVTSERVKFNDIFSVLKTNKYIYAVAFTQLVLNAVLGMGASVYYYTYIVGNIGIMGMMAAVQILALPLVLIFPAFIKRFSAKTLIVAGLLVSAFGYLIFFFAGQNITLVLVAGILTGVGAIPTSMVLVLLIAECADYSEYNGNKRLEGTLSSVVGFMAKIGSAFGAGIFGVILGMSGYNAAVEAVSDTSLMAIKLSYSVFPAILFLITAFMLIVFYNLDKKIPEIRQTNMKNRSLRKEEANGKV